MIKQIGFNYIRLVHSLQVPEVPRLAAELSLLVTEEPGACFHDLSDEIIVGPVPETLRRMIRRIAFLGHVALKGGYPASSVWSVHHGAA